MFKRLISSLAIFLVFLSIHCGIFEPQDRKGSINIQLVNETDNLNLTKRIELLSTVRCVLKRGSDTVHDQTYSKLNGSFHIEIDDLEIGDDYSILLYGKNSSGNIIGRGYRERVEVKIGEVTSVSMSWNRFKPVLISPVDGSTTNDETPSFGWYEVINATLYELEIDNSNSFTNPEIDQDSLTSTSYTATINLSDDTYYWRVHCKDDQNNWGGWSDIWSITISKSTVSTPTFNPLPGKYTTAQNVTITCSTEGASIHYTTNGSDPTESDIVISSGGSVHIATTTTLKARAYMSGWTASVVASGIYTIARYDLIAYYPFNGNANDESGNNFHGTVVGAILTQDRFGNPNSAYYFDGIEDRIELDDVFNDVSVPITVTAWIYLNYQNTGIFRSDVDESETKYYGFWLDARYGKLDISYGDGGDVGHQARRSKFSGTDITLNQWVHVAGVIRGPTDMSLYINGQDVGGIYDGSGGDMVHNSFAAWIGGRNDEQYMIDEVYIYNRALSQEEIQVQSFIETDVFIPAGEFIMGSNEYSHEQPVHTVYIDAYYIDKYEVTNPQYATYLIEALANGDIQASSNTVTKDGKELINLDDSYCQISYTGGQFIVDTGKEDYPVSAVTWYGADAYAKHFGKRLPTEAEWEKAARGTDGRKYPWGDTEPTSSHCNYNSQGSTPVGHYSPLGDSPYGCCDMAGNMIEWCSDWYSSEYYSVSPYSNPQGPSNGEYRVNRGGSWYIFANDVRCATRYGSIPENRIYYRGFRCVR